LITRGGGHSPSDLYGYLEDERITMLGDLVVTQMHPSVGDGFPRAWIRILDDVRRLRPETVVPGHGPVGKARAVTRIQEYLRDLSRLVRTAESAHEPLGSIRVPERYRSWLGSPFFPENLARVRKDLRGDDRRTR
jgi:cyclase